MIKILQRIEMERGDIVLEQHKGKKRDIWHMRIRVIGKNKYIRKSTFQAELGVAATIAQDEYDKIRERLRKDLPVEELNYEQLYHKWRAVKGLHLSKHRKRSVSLGQETYLLPFFGKFPISKLTEKNCTGYWKWRLSYWTEGPGKHNKNVKFFVKKPSGNTLSNERQSFLQVLRWAFKQGYINHIPDFELPYKRPAKNEVARPAFTYNEYQKIMKWVRDEHYKKFSSKPKYANDYGRQMFLSFLGFGFETGMRPNEIFTLKWKQVEIADGDKGFGKYLKINVSKETKTKKRTVISMPRAVSAFKLMQGYSRHTAPDDYVFTTWKGGRVRDYAKQFKRMLVELGIETDMYGDKRVPYSMRHSYITFRLLRGKVLVQDLARNCGNSVEEIEEHYDHVLNEQKADELTGDFAIDAEDESIEAQLGKFLHSPD